MSPRPTARPEAAREGTPPRPALGCRRAGLLLLALAGGCAAEARQPIAYSHAVHVRKLELACELCHAAPAGDGEMALPPLATCAGCHQEPNGASAAERLVVEAVRADREIPWVRLHELPRHVYFTHRRHLSVARIACERCHGDMGSQARPPPHPLVTLTMDTCIDCHREQGASRDCDACHR